MLETNLEKIVRSTLASLQIESTGRVFQKLIRNSLDGEGKPVSRVLPWFCATDDEFRKFVDNWSVVTIAKYKRVHVNYAITLLFHALAQHTGDDSIKCIANRNHCDHTMAYVEDFLCRPESEQAETVDLMVKNGLYSDDLVLFDTSIVKGQSVLFLLSSAPKFKLVNEGYMRVCEEPVYKLLMGGTMQKFPQKGRQYAFGLKQLFTAGIKRTDIGNHVRVENHLKTFIEQAYIIK